jgi:iron-sulfur cluster insertion protein
MAASLADFRDEIFALASGLTKPPAIPKYLAEAGDAGGIWSAADMALSTDAVAERQIVVTENAARRIAALKEQEQAENAFLRIAVSGGGCSGFQYGFTFDEERNEDDVVFERDGVTVVVDEVSLGLLDGAEIDFVEDLMGAAFQVKNPNAASSCGCGNSFSIA